MIYAYIAVMAGVTYLIRLLPFTLVQKKSAIDSCARFCIMFPMPALPLWHSLLFCFPQAALFRPHWGWWLPLCWPSAAKACLWWPYGPASQCSLPNVYCLYKRER